MLFGICALIASGMSWTVVGAVLGAAPKKNVSAAAVQLWGALGTVIISVILCLLMVNTKELLRKDFIWFFAAYFGSGFTNCIGMSLMSNAMQKGPNGIIWTIVQSAMIYPFMVGIICFGVEGSLLRYAGLLVILAALVCFGLGKDNSKKSSLNWKLPAFASFLVIGLQQNLHSLPSYYEVGRAIPVMARAIFPALGTIVCAIIMMIMFRKSEASIRENFANKYFWFFVLGLKCTSLLVTYLLQFPGIDAITACGLGSAAYPIMVSSCLIGFFFYSALFLHEKIRWLQFIALTCCFAGIIMICC